ncbi:MAG TPA: acyltransferase [Amycolatopsis sp.]|jgi:peptidoglycan/LPS O-acetylase OafA/YrhL
MSRSQTVTLNTTLTRARLPSLAGLRWVAAVGVFMYHATGPFMFPTTVFPEAVPFALRNVGGSGLSFFFILTGFLLTWSARPKDTKGRFWLRRFVRLYPNHLITLAIMVVLLDFTHLLPYRAQATGVWQSVLLVHAWSPDPFVMIGANAVSWSLSVDAFFLLLFPFWLKLLNRIRPDRLWYYAAGVFGLMLLVPFIAAQLPSQPMLPDALIGRPTSAWQWWLVYDSPLTRCLECFLGSLAARLLLHGKLPALRLRYVLPVVAGVYAFSIFFLPINFYGIVLVLAPPMLLLTVALTQADIRGQRTVLNHPVLVWLGGVSYAFYLLHRIVLEVFISGFGAKVPWTIPTAIAALVALLGLTTGLAYLLYILVERPMLRRFSPPDPTGRPDTKGQFIPVSVDYSLRRASPEHVRRRDALGGKENPAA